MNLDSSANTESITMWTSWLPRIQCSTAVTKVSPTDEDEEVNVVEENGEERLVLSRIVICRENVVKSGTCLTIFR